MKKQFAVVMAAMMAAGMMAGCSSKPQETTAAATEAETAAEETTRAETEAETETETEGEAKADLGEQGILVAAAASLKNAYEDELIPMFEEQYPGVTVEGTYDSSGKLQTQIEEGLEADVFMSAAVKQMKALDEEGMIASDTIVDLLENKIVLIVPAGSDSKIDSFEKIGDAASIALGDPESVPAGQYAKEALTNLNVWDSIQDKVSFGTNVTEVLSWVAAGSADAGIVYLTDATTSDQFDQVKVIGYAPEGSVSKVIYPVGVVSASTKKDAAQKFVDYLGTDDALSFFAEYGFTANK